MDPDRDPLMLDELTGLVHAYEGASFTGPIPCGCEHVNESVEADSLTLIYREHLERGIWEPADCLDG